MPNTIDSFSGRVVGSGLLARAFLLAPVETYRNACIYAAGVSNSSCTSEAEFDRERKRLSQALSQAESANPFIYFGTCSVGDPEVRETPYVQHKMAMEMRVASRSQHLIFRLPQVVGITPNPHTLLNFLHARIARSEQFTVWENARRNVIDVDDVVLIAQQFIQNPSLRNKTLNIANPVSYSILDIIRALEDAIGKPAVYNLVNRGSVYAINTNESSLAASRAGVRFFDDYLNKVIGKYYGNPT